MIYRIQKRRERERVRSERESSQREKERERVRSERERERERKTKLADFKHSGGWSHLAVHIQILEHEQTTDTYYIYRYSTTYTRYYTKTSHS